MTLIIKFWNYVPMKKFFLRVIYSPSNDIPSKLSKKFSGMIIASEKDRLQYTAIKADKMKNRFKYIILDQSNYYHD